MWLNGQRLTREFQQLVIPLSVVRWESLVVTVSDFANEVNESFQRSALPPRVNAKAAAVVVCVLMVVSGFYRPFVSIWSTKCGNNLESAPCLDRVVRYHPSDVETSWREEIETVKSNEPSWSDGCRKLRAEENQLRQVIAGIQNHDAGQRRELSKYHLSSHEIQDSSGAKRRVYLEPLVSRVFEVYS